MLGAVLQYLVSFSPPKWIQWLVAFVTLAEGCATVYLLIGVAALKSGVVRRARTPVILEHLKSLEKDLNGAINSQDKHRILTTYADLQARVEAMSKFKKLPREKCKDLAKQVQRERERYSGLDTARWVRDSVRHLRRAIEEEHASEVLRGDAN